MNCAFAEPTWFETLSRGKQDRSAILNMRASAFDVRIEQAYGDYSNIIVILLQGRMRRDRTEYCQ